MAASQLRMSSRPPMPEVRSRRSALARSAAPFALTLVLIGAPQWLGGIYPSAMIGISIAAGLCLLLALSSVRSVDFPRGLLLAVAVLPVAWTALQVAPLPCGLVESLSPLSASRLQGVYDLFELAKPSQCVLTRDPSATLEEVVKGLAIACAMVSASMLASSGRQRWVFAAVAASTVIMAAVAVGHVVADAERVFGVYKPIELRGTRFVAPLLNPNNLGGFLAMGVPILIGLAIEQTNPRVRFLMLGTVGAVAATALMTRSRGAAGAVALGPALYAILAWARTRTRTPGREPRGRHGGPRWLRLATPLGLAMVLALAGFAWFDELAAEFEMSGSDKIDLIVDAAEFATTVPWIGVGRGGFSGAFVGSPDSHYRFDYAESLPVQWAVDWGIGPAIALMIALGVLYLNAIAQTRSHARIGALAAVATVLAQNLVDLGLELLGPAIVAAALFGATVSFPQHVTRTRTRARMLRGAMIALALLAIGTPIWLATPLRALHGPIVEQDLTARIAPKMPPSERKAFAERLRAGMLAHPSEPMLAIMAAHEALLARDPRAGRFINRGMVLAPGWAAPHVQAAQWLWNRGLRRQALLEVRAAAELDMQSIGTILCPMVRSSPREAFETAPTTPVRRYFLEHMVRCLDLDSPQAREIDRELARIAPEFETPALREAMRFLRENKQAEAEAAARTALKIAPDNATAYDLLAQALENQGKHDAALKLLEDAVNAGVDPIAMYERRGRIAVRHKDAEAMREAMSALRGWVGADPQRLHNTYRAEGDFERELGNIGASLHAFEEAYRLVPSPDALLGVGSAAERLGDKRRAEQAYRSACELGTEAAAQAGCRELRRLQSVKP